MQTFNEFLQKLYIEDSQDLSKALNENLAINESDALELSNDLIVSSKLQKIEKLILVGKLNLKSIQMLKDDGIEEKYVNVSTAKFKIGKNSISIQTKDEHFTLTEADAENTVVLMRSGYTKPAVAGAIKYIEDLGILVINAVEPVKVSSDKFLTAELLTKYNISQPKYCLITSDDIDKEDTKCAEEKLKTLYDRADDNTKYVCKILNGHGGRGVFICRKSNIMSILQCIFAIDETCPILVQEFGELKDGDIRVHVISLNGKQKIVGSIIRLKGDDDFRTNLSLGNKMQDYELNDTQKKLALNAAKASGLVWCGVDIMPLKNGQNKIVEFNGAPGPASDIDDEDIETTNYKFFKKIINTINSLCQQ